MEVGNEGLYSSQDSKQRVCARLPSLLVLMRETGPGPDGEHMHSERVPRVKDTELGGMQD